MKKKVAFINAVPYGSTGKIVRGIAEVAEEKNYESLIFYGWSKKLRKSELPNVVVGSFLERMLHISLSRLTGLNGLFSVIDTMRVLRKLDKFNPDIINLHILHSWNINLPMLFSYIKKKNIPVVWTMHDCWAFTGQCPHFVMAKCDKWKTGCYECSQYKQYPQSYVDQTRLMWKLKKKWFTGVNNMTIVTPSEWLAQFVSESFLKEYPVKVINNGIDLNVFKPTESNFRSNYNCTDKKMLLGVAFDWGKRKGLDVVIELHKRLSNQYQFVLVGTDKVVDEQLPKDVISIHRTQNQKELAEIYTAADLFINPTREDTYPTVNMEAIACGLPVLTFRTGGSPEILDEETGSVVECNDVEGMRREIERICTAMPYSKEKCRAKAKQFEMWQRFEDYVRLMEKMIV